MAKKKSKNKETVKKKVTNQIVKGRVYISSSFNNTIITVTDTNGDVIKWGSSGNAGFKGTRKSTPFAATTAVDGVINSVKEENGMKEVEVYLKGPGPGRDAALRAIKACGLKISLIADLTPIPHNGPRQKKKRRV